MASEMTETNDLLRRIAQSLEGIERIEREKYDKIKKAEWDQDKLLKGLSDALGSVTVTTESAVEKSFRETLRARGRRATTVKGFYESVGVDPEDIEKDCDD